MFQSSYPLYEHEKDFAWPPSPSIIKMSLDDIFQAFLFKVVVLAQKYILSLKKKKKKRLDIA